MLVVFVGSFLFWGCLTGESPLQQVCDTLQETGISPQQLLVREPRKNPTSMKGEKSEGGRRIWVGQIGFERVCVCVPPASPVAAAQSVAAQGEGRPEEAQRGRPEPARAARRPQLHERCMFTPSRVSKKRTTCVLSSVGGRGTTDHSKRKMNLEFFSLSLKPPLLPRGRGGVVGPSVCLPLVAAGAHCVRPVPPRRRRPAGGSGGSPCRQGLHHQPGRQQGKTCRLFYFFL